MLRLLLGVFAPLLVAVTMLVPTRPAVPVAAAQGQASREPLDYFREMMPVYIHDRCINCHGAVNPSTGQDHDGGQIDPGESCTASGCHTQADNGNQDPHDDWKIAPAAVWFVKLAGNQFVTKDDKELCNQMADRVASFGSQDFLDHLQNDFQIDLGFEGRSGGANSDPQPVRPPMPKTRFLIAAARWVDDGFAACDREGTIIHTESITSDETQGAGSSTETRAQQSGKRTVTIRFANGQYRAEVEVKGQTILTQTINGPGCRTIITSFHDYEDASPVVSGSQTRGNIAAGADLDVKLEPDGSYTITVLVGEEKHVQHERATVVDGCRSGVQPSAPETLEQVWPETRFLIRGKLLNPRDRSRLVGRDSRVWFERGASPDEDPWLPDHYAATALNGKFHPVDVKTTWHIRYRP